MILKKCPICHKSFNLKYKPFCSQKCKSLDLHRWLNGVYRIPTEEKPVSVGTQDKSEEKNN